MTDKMSPHLEELLDTFCKQQNIDLTAEEKLIIIKDLKHDVETIGREELIKSVGKLSLKIKLLFFSLEADFEKAPTRLLVGFAIWASLMFFLSLVVIILVAKFFPSLLQVIIDMSN